MTDLARLEVELELLRSTVDDVAGANVQLVKARDAALAESQALRLSLEDERARRARLEAELSTVQVHLRGAQMELGRARMLPSFGELAALKAELDPLRVSSTERLDNIVRRIVRELRNLTTERNEWRDKYETLARGMP